jgi:hypothetical protein
MTSIIRLQDGPDYDPLMLSMFESLSEVIGHDGVERFLEIERGDGNYDPLKVEATMLSMIVMNVRIMMFANDTGYSEETMMEIREALHQDSITRVYHSRKARTVH